MSKFKQLQNAIENTEYDFIYSLLKLNLVSYEQQNDDGDTLLHLSLSFLCPNNILYDKIINYIIDHMIDLDIQNNNGFTCLHVITSRILYDIKYVKKICDRMKNVNIKNNYGNIPLFYGLIYQKYDIINLLIDKIEENYQNESNYTLLHFGLKYHFSDDILNKILLKTSNINAKNNNNDSILHFALEYCNINFIKILLEHPDINYNQANINNELPLHIAIKKLSTHTSENIRIIKKIVDKTIDINFQDCNSNSILNIAIIYNREKYIRILLERNDINYNIIDNEGNNLLHLLASSYINDIDIFNKIIKKMNNIFVQNNQNHSFLHIALIRRNIKFINMTLDYILENTDVINLNLYLYNKNYINIAINYLSDIYDSNIYAPILINLIKLGIKYEPNKIYRINPNVKQLLIYYDKGLNYESIPKEMKMDQKQTEMIIKQRKDKIYFHPLIQREMSKDLLTYVHVVKQKTNSIKPKQIYKSTRLLYNRVWLRHILRFNKDNYDNFFTEKDDIDFTHLL